MSYTVIRSNISACKDISYLHDFCYARFEIRKRNNENYQNFFIKTSCIEDTHFVKMTCVSISSDITRRYDDIIWRQINHPVSSDNVYYLAEINVNITNANMYDEFDVFVVFKNTTSIDTLSNTKIVYNTCTKGLPIYIDTVGTNKRKLEDESDCEIEQQSKHIKL